MLGGENARILAQFAVLRMKTIPISSPSVMSGTGAARLTVVRQGDGFDPVGREKASLTSL